MPKKVLVIGNLIDTAITGASRRLGRRRHSPPVATPHHPSEGDAITYFLARERTALMCRRPRAVPRRAALRVRRRKPGTAATAVLTFATAASAAFTVRLKLCGQVTTSARIQATDHHDRHRCG